MLLQGGIYLRAAPKALKKLQRHPCFLDYSNFCSTPMYTSDQATLPLLQKAQNFWFTLPQCRSAYGGEVTYSLRSIRAHAPPLSVLKEITSPPGIQGACKAAALV